MRFSPRRLALVFALLVWWCQPLHAQGAWDAILNIDPYPSPYYSDWDVDPNIATLTVINTTTAAQQVRIHFNVSDRANKIVISGSSDAQNIGAGATVIFDNPYDVAGSTHRDEAEDEIAARTGRLREGDYTACAVVADMTGFSLAESCADFTIVYPDPPLLLGPDHGEVVTQVDPLFQWTPVQVPVDFQLSYVMRIVEVLSGQTPQEALRSNIPHFQSLNEQFPNLRYPIDARPFEIGKQYAWTVQVLDQNGYAAAGNDGRSEIWTFSYSDEPAVPGADYVTLTFGNDDSADTSADEDETTGLAAVCDSWQTPVSVFFPVSSSFFPARITAPSAVLVRDVSSSRRDWAIFGRAGDKLIILAGDCGITGDRTIARWVGLRTANDAQELDAWLAGGEPHVDDAGHKLKFGLIAISLFEQEIGGEDASGAVRDFLEGHTIGLKPGINLYGVLDARQWPGLWSLLSSVHTDDEHELTLQGFVGLNTSYAVRVGLVGDRGVEGAAMAEYLTLTGTFPKKNFDNQYVKSLQFGMEITYGDSIARGMTPGRGRDLVIKPLMIAVEWTPDETNEDALRTWTGTLEADLSMGTKHWLVGLPTGEVKWTARLTTDGLWQPGPLKAAGAGFGHVQLYLDINKGWLAAVRQRSTKQFDWDFNVRGSFVWHDEEIATAIVTVGSKPDPKQYWTDQSKTSAEQLRRARSLVDDEAEKKETALIAGDTATAALFHQRYLQALEIRDRLQKAADLDAKMLKDYEKRYATGDETSRQKKDRKTTTGRKWQVSLQFGNMSLLNLYDLIGNIAATQRGGTP